MKKNIILSLLLALSLSASHAQDIIVKTDASEIEAKVDLVSSNSITFHRWNNLDGPSYTLNKDEVMFIRYQNGQKEVFTTVDTKFAPTRHYQPNKKVRFNAYLTSGVDFIAIGAGPIVNLSFGPRFTDYFFLGFEVGFHDMFYKELRYSNNSGYYYYLDWVYYIPFAVNMKGFIPINKNIMPHINLSLGYAFYTGFYCNVGLGIDIKHFTVGIGYMNLGTILDCGYFKLGVRMGK
ncbi:MAG: hypothetical protein K2G46_08035 [Bacteroidales bacterium]|nr:hypothetical protein [Bacteroidales bacterium]